MDPTRARPRSGSVRDPSSSVGRPNIAGSGAGCSREVSGELAAMADEGDEVGHPRAPSALPIRLVDRARGRQRRLPVGEERRERGLVRHERPHVLGVLGDQRQRVHRAAAAGEQVDRSASELLDDPVDVVGVLLGRRRGGRLGQLAALAPARVVGDHGAVGEVARQGAEAGRAHRRGGQEQGRGVRRVRRGGRRRSGLRPALPGCGW